jgi:vacuolar-type H+-ATPase subunit H
MVEPEKTILQQIREKEQDYAEKLEGIKKETEAAIAAARKDAADLVSTADSAGKKAAEQVYREEKGRAEKDIEEIKKQAVLDRETTLARGEKNLERAARKIAGYVTAE